MPLFSRRRVAFSALGLLASVATTGAIGPALAVGANGNPVSPGGLTLRQTLEKGLKARRPSEFAFIARVVHKVDGGDLPQEMVERTFLWARNHHQPFPMPYFERAMQIQAKKLHVDL